MNDLDHYTRAATLYFKLEGGERHPGYPDAAFYTGELLERLAEARAEMERWAARL